MSNSYERFSPSMNNGFAEDESAKNLKTKEENKRKMKMKAKLFVAVLAIMLLSFNIGQAWAPSEGDSDGTVTVTSAAPTITNVELWDSGETIDKNNTALTIDTEYHLNYTISDENTLADLDNCTIIIWNSGGGIAEGGDDSERNHYTFTWIESTAAWASSPATFHNDAACQDPGTASGEESYEFTLAFDLSKVANYSNTGAPYDGWDIKIYVYDDTPNSDTDTTGQFGIASYIDISITETTHSFSGAPGSTDNEVSAGGDGKIDFTVVTNYEYHVQVKSLNATVSTNGYSFNIGNVTHYGSAVAGSSEALTLTYANITGLTSVAPAATESGESKGVYLWVDIPALQETGDYTYVLRIQIVKAD